MLSIAKNDTFFHQQDFSLLERYVLRANYSIHKLIDFKKGMAKAYHFIGVVHWHMGDLSMALKYYQKALPIIIDSYGGEVYSLMAMIDLLNSSGLEIITISNGKSMSCGAILLSIGKKRFATENSTIMIHNAHNRACGDVDKLKNTANETERLNNKAFSLLDINSNQPTGFWKNINQKSNYNDVRIG